MNPKVKSQKSKVKGFTLLEFILYFALISLVMTAIIGFSLDFVRSRNKALIVAQVEQETRFGLMRILRAVRQATRLNVGSSTFDSATGTLSVDQSATSTTPTVFDVSSGTLRIKEGSGSATPLTSPDVEVTKLRFSKDNLGGNNNAVTVELTVRYASTSPSADFNYTVAASGTAVIRKD
jgi:type II secretory pathway pseudopilin PulG